MTARERILEILNKRGNPESSNDGVNFRVHIVINGITYTAISMDETRAFADLAEQVKDLPEVK